MPDRGLLAPLSPHEEVTLRRVAIGIVKLADLPARDVERLSTLPAPTARDSGQLRNHPPWGEAAPHGSFMRGLTDRPYSLGESGS